MHPRDAQLIFRVRLAREGGEEWLFSRIGEQTPTEHRKQVAEVFAKAARESIAAPWQNDWNQWCEGLAKRALRGGALAPFSREDIPANEELLNILPALLSWPSESLIRFASCVICGDSKRLDQLRSKLEACLAQLSAKDGASLEDFGLLETPRYVLLHGSLKLELQGDVLDLGLFHGPVRISEVDIRKASSLTTSATRCLTVENETSFYELAKLNSGTLLIQTSYPGRAVLETLRRLPAEIHCWHFGDSDPAGFDILRDLRKRSGRRIEPLHMKYRPLSTSTILSEADRRLTLKLCNEPLMSDLRVELERLLETGRKGAFEQETLGRPRMRTWPFYQDEGYSLQTESG
jgi:hypothetical protein